MKKNIIYINIFLILLIILIYEIFFPKKSYIQKKLEQPTIITEEIFKSNIEQMKTASNEYFKEKEGKATLEELEKQNLITELKDSNDELCDKNSYIKKEGNHITIELKCPDKEQKLELSDEKNKLLCLYEYKKVEQKTYTEWSDWSEWTTEKKEENDITKVETKEEQEPDGTETITYTTDLVEDPIYNGNCDSGFEYINQKCQKKTELNTISASIRYTCKEGYNRSGLYCINQNEKINSTREYYCPNNEKDLEFELTGNKCKIYQITTVNPKETNNICKEGYELKENKCYKTEYHEEEIEKYKDVTYYRYKTRTKTEEKIDIKWSKKDDKELLNQEYTVNRKISCEF